jgi:hypothetical protein
VVERDYNVTIPPQVVVSDNYGSGVLANANTTGVIDSIVVTDPGYNFKDYSNCRYHWGKW